MIVAIGAWIIGTSLNWSSPADSQLKNVSSPNANNSDFGGLTIDPLSTLEFSWAASLINLGALVGGLSGGALIDLVGRRQVMMLTCLPFIVGWILLITAVSPGRTETFRNRNQLRLIVMARLLSIQLCCISDASLPE